MEKTYRRINFIVFIATTFFLTSCGDLTQGTVTSFNDGIYASSHACPGAGHIYTMRGWLGIFSMGMNRLAKNTQKTFGICSTAVAYSEWKMLSEFISAKNKSRQLQHPLILIGHSYGADNQIKVAQELNKEHIAVDLLVTLDPVTPDLIPPNVKHELNLYKSHPHTDSIPVLRGMPLAAVDSSETRVENINLRPILPKDAGDTTHFNIDDNKYAQQIIFREIYKLLLEYKQLGE